MNFNLPQQPFLATTALEEFWDTSKPLLFLGESCRRYSRKEYWEKLGGRVVESPWDNSEKLHKAYDYVNDVYERLLPQLGNALNNLHGVRRSERYWRILLGPWLQLYIPVVYDRFMSLQVALSRYPDLTTIILDDEAWVTPRDTMEFIQLIKEDSYNLQLFSAILKVCNKDFPHKEIKVVSNPFAITEKPSCWQEKLKNNLIGMLIKVNRAFKDEHSVIFRDSYFSWKVEMIFILTSFGAIWPIIGRPLESPCLRANRITRMNLLNLFSGDDEFECLLHEMLPIDLPGCFVEDFDTVRGNVENDYPSPPKAVFSSVAWYCDEAFKQWAAASAEVGTKLFGVQHGGNYGSLAFHPSENHEIAITDHYYSWGWDKSNTSTIISPFYAAKLSGRKILGADNRQEGILFVATSAPRFLFQFPHIPERFNDYLLWQLRFAQVIPQELLPKMRIRFHREDLGWDIADRWKDLCPEVSVEGWDVSFRQSLKNCRIYLSDNLATTFLEALSADKPTILFWNPAINELRTEAEPYYECLRAAGILYDTPESAAKAVADIYEDVESWWNQPDRQVARIKFCQRFARTSSNAVKLWSAEFRRIAKTCTTAHFPVRL